MMTYTIQFTHDEVQQLAAFVDLSLKSVGVQALKPAHALIAKLEAAEPDAPQATDDLSIEAEND